MLDAIPSLKEGFEIRLLSASKFLLGTTCIAGRKLLKTQAWQMHS